MVGIYWKMILNCKRKAVWMAWFLVKPNIVFSLHGSYQHDDTPQEEAL